MSDYLISVGTREKGISMNGYVAFWDGKQVEVYADSSYLAQAEAVVAFQKNTRKKVKSYDVTVVLAEKNNEQVTHYFA